VQYLRDICEISPDSYETNYELGNLLLRFDSLDEAEIHLERAKKINPGSCDTHRILGDLNVKKSRLHDACIHYRAALRINPVSIEAYCNLGAVLNELKMYEEAEECLRKSLTLENNSPRVYFNLSLTVANQNRFEEARELAIIGIKLSVDKKDKVLLIEHLLDLCQKQNARDLFGQQLAIYSRELWPVSDSEFDRLYTEGLFKTGTMFSPSRRRNRFRFLIQKFQEVQDLDGDIAECGCFKGLSSFLLCSTMKKNDESFSGTGYQIFDSFEGLSTPATVDQNKDYGNDRAPPKAIISSGHFAASVESVKHALDQFPNIEYFKGWIPEAFPANSDKKYKFVHVDVDLYQPTFDSFSYFWPLINKGGIMLCDDFNWSGARQAVEDFSKYNNIRFDVSEFNQAYFKKE
jgi:tetratricopeptide (TPR) repeat protein